MAQDPSLSPSRLRYSSCICICSLGKPALYCACFINCLRYKQIPGIGIVLQLVATRGLQSDKLDIEDESRLGRDEVTKTTRSWISSVGQIMDEFPPNPARQTVCLPRGDSENAFFVETHVKETFLPSWNDLASADCTTSCQKGQLSRGSQDARVSGKGSLRSWLHTCRT